MSSAADSLARTTRPTAFLSYARGDQERAERLATALRQAGVEVWWDTLIEGGAEFTKSIEAAINRADAGRRRLVATRGRLGLGARRSVARPRPAQAGAGVARRHRTANGLPALPDRRPTVVAGRRRHPRDQPHRRWYRLASSS